MSASAAMLAEVPVFSLLDKEERTTLAELLDHETYKAGALIYDYGDAGDCLYVLRSGRVQVYVESTDGEKIIVGDNEPGEVFGEISLLDAGPRNSTAVAVEDSEVLVLDRGDLMELIKLHPHAALDLLTVMGRRLRKTDELLRTHVSRNANVEEEERLTLGQRVADRVATFGGSWTFIIIFGVVLLGWIAVNTYVLRVKPFDPYPYILLNLVLSMLAAIQAPVIMMSQNRQAAKDRLKSDLDYEVNMKAELEIAQLHAKVDRMYETSQAHWAAYQKEKKLDASLTEGAKKPNDYY